MWFIFACTSGTYDVSYTTQREQTDTSAGEVEDSGAEIEEEPASASDLFCPDNMVSVRDEWGDPVYCIDRFEISVYGTELGNADQGLDWPDASTTALAISELGVVPEMYISWYQAYALCQNSGKYLCTHSEWEDGCDGHYGGGGYKYPYGDQWFEGWCAARLGEEPQVYDTAQETGTHAQCESFWGTFDQIGNVWEWVDSMLDDDQGYPIAYKVGASYYSGGGNTQCRSEAVSDHQPSFAGVIGARCCSSPILSQ